MEPRDLSAHAEYRAGRGVEAVAAARDRDPGEFVALSSNENPLGPSPAAAEAVRAAADRLHRYPKASRVDLVDALAEKWGVADAQVWLGNGGGDALDYLARATLEPGQRVLVPRPGFAYYAMSARYHHGDVATYRLERGEDAFDLSADAVLSAYDGERVVYVTSPHNPTGAHATLDDVEAVAAGTGEETLVVVDEAYGEFHDGPSAVRLLSDRDDVAVLRSFSKAHGLAGLRLGYALVPREWADAYARVTTPFAAGELACRAGLAALDDDDHVARSVAAARRGRRYVAREADCRTFDSRGNFVLCEVGDATEVTAALADRGVVVRDCSSFGLPDCVRVTAGTGDETERAVTALNEVLAA